MTAEKKDKIIRMLIIAVVFAIVAFSVPNNTVKLFSAIMGVVFVIVAAVGFCPSFLITGVDCGAEKRKKILVEKQMDEVAKELGL